jgi:hypothetical protein
VAHKLAHKNVLNVPLKQWMQCKFFRGNLALVDFKRVVDTVGVWGSNPHATTNPFNDLPQLSVFYVAPQDTI